MREREGEREEIRENREEMGEIAMYGERERERRREKKERARER